MPKPFPMRSLYLATTVVILCSITITNAQTWTFKGGVIDSSRFRAHTIETRGDTILVGTSIDASGPFVWISYDAGENWHTSIQFFGRCEVQCFGFHKDMIFAGGTASNLGAGSSIMRSKDGGKSWASSYSGIMTDTLYLPFGKEYVPGKVTSFFSTVDKIFAGTRNGLAMSTDDGDTWTHIATEVFDTRSVVSGFAGTSDKIFAATSLGVFESIDGGVTWTKAGTGIPDNRNIGDIIVYKERIVADGYYSEDDGDTWIQMGTLDIDPSLGTELVSMSGIHDFAAKGDTLFAGARVGSKIGTFYSVDDGTSWKIIDAFEFYEYPDIVVDFQGLNLGRHIAANERFLYTARLQEEQRVYRSTGGIDDWEKAGEFSGISLLATNHEDLLYAVTTLPFVNIFGDMEAKKTHLYRSSDEGVTWEHVFTVPEYHQVFSLDMGPSVQTTENEIVFVARGHGGKQSFIYYSPSQGDEWKTIAMPTADTIVGITNGGTSWIAQDRRNNFYRTKDQGDTWTPISFGEFEDVSRLVNTDGKLYAVACKKILKSTDDGDRWTLASETKNCLNRPVRTGEYFREHFNVIVINDDHTIINGYENVYGNYASSSLGEIFYNTAVEFLPDDDPRYPYLYNSATYDDFRFSPPLSTPQGFIASHGTRFLSYDIIDNFLVSTDLKWRAIGLNGYPAPYFSSWGADEMVYMDGSVYIQSLGGVWSRPLDDLINDFSVPEPVVTAAEDESQFDFTLAYPNPVSDKLFINDKHFGSGKWSVVIYDVLGNERYRSFQTNTVDVTSLPAGMYILVAEGLTETLKTKFVKN